MLWWTLRQLRSKDSEKRWRAAEELGKSGDPRAVEPLLEALRTGICKEVLWALRRLNDQRALPGLVEALKSPFSSYRSLAVLALGEMGDPRAVPELVLKLTDIDADVRRDVCKALGQLRDQRAVGPLVAALSDAEHSVRMEAAEALGDIGGPEAERVLVHGLEQALSQGDASGQYDLVRGLAHLKWKPETQRLRALRAVALKEFEEAAAEGEAAMPYLDQATRVKWHTFQSSAEYDLPWKACDALAKAGGPKALDFLVALLQHPDEKVRERAVTNLGKIGDRRALEPLIRQLKDEGRSVGSCAAMALGELGDPRAIPGLLACLSAKDDFLRERAAEALGKIGDAQTVPALLASLKDPDWPVRRNAAQALGRIADARAAEPLLRALLDRQQEVRDAALEAFENMGGDPQGPEQRALLKVGKCKFQEALAEGPAALEPLVAALWFHADDEHGPDVAAALGSMGDARAVKPLFDLLQVADEPRPQILEMGHSKVAAVSAIADVLKQSAPAVPQELLGQLSGTKDPQIIVRFVAVQMGFDREETGAKAVRQTVDCSAVRKLAEQELARRGHGG